MNPKPISPTLNDEEIRQKCLEQERNTGFPDAQIDDEDLEYYRFFTNAGRDRAIKWVLAELIQEGEEATALWLKMKLEALEGR